MARIAANGAVVADNGWWYWSGLKWSPLVTKPPEKAPGYYSRERLTLVTVVKGRKIGEMRNAGDELARIIAEKGSLAAAEAALASAASGDLPGSLRSAPAEESDVLDQLKRLGALRDSGVITTVEFEAKKAEFLRRL